MSILSHYAFGFAGGALACAAGCFSKPTPRPPVTLSIERPAAATQTRDVQAGLARDDALPIVTIQFRDHTITVFTGPDAPRFTVAAHDGLVLATLLTADEMRERHPEIYEAYESSFASLGADLDASLGDRH